MPKTKFQSFIFTIFMVFLMVLCMTIYTLSIQLGTLNSQVFYMAIKEMWLEYVVVFLLIFFVMTDRSIKTARKMIDFKTISPIFMTLLIQCLTVCQIVPVITLFATMIHHGIGADCFFIWLKLMVECFPMALCLQLFFVGPFVRTVFRKIF